MTHAEEALAFATRNRRHFDGRTNFNYRAPNMHDHSTCTSRGLEMHEGCGGWWRCVQSGKLLGCLNPCSNSKRAIMNRKVQKHKNHEFFARSRGTGNLMRRRTGRCKLKAGSTRLKLPVVPRLCRSTRPEITFPASCSVNFLIRTHAHMRSPSYHYRRSGWLTDQVAG